MEFSDDTQFNNQTVFKNIAWRYAERILAQGIAFIISLILARLLEPSEYGIIAIVMVLISFIDVFSSRGFTQALIQKQNVDDLDYSTVFYTNFFIELVLYIMLYASAPYVASFYRNEALISIIRILGLSVLINSFNSVQQTYVQRNLQYKKFFLSTLIGTVISGIVGVVMAYKGFKVWSLVAQSMLNRIIDTLVLFTTIAWKPRLEYSLDRLKYIWKYGLKMLASGLLESFYTEIRTLAIGKVYTSSDLAYYEKGKNLPALIINNIQISISGIFFVTLSREKTNEAIKNRMKNYLNVTFSILCPILLGVAVVARPLISVLYSEKWVIAAPYTVIYCFSFLTWIIQIPWLQALNAMGKAGTSLTICVIHRFIGISLLLLLMMKGPIFIALSAMLADIFVTTMLYFTIYKYLRYSLKDLIADIGKTCIAGLGMSLSVIMFIRFFEYSISKLISGVAMGISVYVLMSIITKNDGFLSALKVFRRTRKK